MSATGFDAPRGGVDLAVSAGLLGPPRQAGAFSTEPAGTLPARVKDRGLADLHRAIAEHPQRRRPGPWDKLRCGEHLVAAGDHQVAFETLLAAEALARGER